MSECEHCQDDHLDLAELIEKVGKLAEKVALLGRHTDTRIKLAKPFSD